MIEPISDIIVIICLLSLFSAIIINFFEADRKNVRHEKKSIVETGSMIGFFILFYVLIKFRIGSYDLPHGLQVFSAVAGLTMIAAGTCMNILGRFNLGKNWANQVVLYKNQTLIKSGAYGFVRHPLYASLMCMFYGASIAYSNYLSLLANTFIFIPFMFYRAKQEEEILSKNYTHYKKYKEEVGMFFPKIR